MRLEVLRAAKDMGADYIDIELKVISRVSDKAYDFSYFIEHMQYTNFKHRELI